MKAKSATRLTGIIGDKAVRVLLPAETPSSLAASKASSRGAAQ